MVSQRQSAVFLTNHLHLCVNDVTTLAKLLVLEEYLVSIWNFKKAKILLSSIFVAVSSQPL